MACLERSPYSAPSCSQVQPLSITDSISTRSACSTDSLAQGIIRNALNDSFGSRISSTYPLTSRLVNRCVDGILVVVFAMLTQLAEILAKFGGLFVSFQRS